MNNFKKQLILISQDWTRLKDPPMSLGHASILTNIINKAPVISSSYSENSTEFSPKKVIEFIMNNSNGPDTDVALGAFVWNERSIQTILKGLKEYKFPGKIILGGPQVSYLKQDIEKFYPQADLFIRGYAENVLLDYLTTGNENIKGIHKAGGFDLGLSANANLESLLSPFLEGIIKPQRFIRWETQRGCPFRCSFCQHREPDEVSSKRRTLSLTRVVREAQWITENPVIQDIAVLDPIFNSGPHYLEILDQLIKGKYSGKISFQSRLEMVKPEFLERISKLNETATVVLEFGLQTIHFNEQSMIDRPNNMKKVKDILNRVTQMGIKHEISLIFGLPLQTLESFRESVEFATQFNGVVHAFPLMLLRGTPLYHRKVQLGLIESNEIVSNEIDRLQTDINHVVTSPSFSYTDWREMVKISELLEGRNEALL